MSTLAFVNPQNLIDRLGTTETIDPTVQTRPGWRWLAYVESRPAFDPATELLEGPTLVVDDTSATRTWTKRLKTQAELDADKDAIVDRVDAAVFKVLFNHENRIRVLEGRAQITAAQFKAALRAIV